MAASKKNISLPETCLRIIYEFTSGDNAYTFNSVYTVRADLPRLADGREQLGHFIAKMADTDNCLN